MKKILNKLFGFRIYASAFLLLSFIFVATSFNAVAAPASWFSEFQNKATFKSERVKAALVVHAPTGIQAQEEFWLGLKIDHEPMWHTYWKNPGDVGVATQLSWSLPAGLEVQEVEWPTPQMLYVGDTIIDYGYENTILLPVKVKVGKDFNPANLEQLEVKLSANWLVCRTECIPETFDFVLNVDTQNPSVSEASLFQTTWQNLPVAVEGMQATARVEVDAKDTNKGVLHWQIAGLPNDWQGKDIQLLPEQPRIMVNSGALNTTWKEGVWQASYELSYNRGTEPQQIEAILLPPTGVDAQAAIKVTAAISGKWPALKTYSIPPSLLNDAGQNTAQERVPSQLERQTGSFLLVTLGLAFLGGLLLNLMPCVFPVLSVKALTFIQADPQAHKAQRLGGLAYALGVVLTMLLLATLLLLLRAGGSGLGWGFQLQSPVFIALLAGLFVLIGLNLLGVYEVRLFLPARISNARGKTPVADSFLTGVVSVLVATPCTAPYMGMALGVALTLPAWQNLTIFAALGAGLAFPMVLIAFIPQLFKWMPKPGMWMETFRHFMAFPMFLTVLWLLWVLGAQVGEGGTISLLGALLALTFLMWVLGWRQKTVSKSKKWKNIAPLLALLITLGAWCWFIPPIFSSTGVQSPIENNQITNKAGSAAMWQSWSPEKVEQLRAQGKPVFVNFTAAWCVTCQLNKKTTLTQADVLKKFADKNVVLLEADWTSYDSKITQGLELLGRSGVPVYVLYPVGKEPVLLPEVITPSIIYEALEAVN